MTPPPFMTTLANGAGGHAASRSQEFSPLRILDEAQAGGLVLQDFRPLAESLEWELGQEYFRERGSLAFIGDHDPVPFVVNNDGSLSIKAAEVFFTSLVEADKAGKLQADIFVLELGIGVGLFARFFLDWFERLCEQSGKDYYDRLCYVAADYSPKMLRDAGRHGIFQNHPGRYRLRVADALCPERTLLADADIAALGPRPFRAMFLNYLLDCLPATVLQVAGEQVQQLHVRTCLPKGAEWRAHLDATEADLRQMAASGDPADRRELLAVYPLILAEYQFRPVDREEIPYPDFALEQVGSAGGKPVVLSHGAMLCLESLVDLLAEGGVILLNEYGQTKEITTEEFEHQRFSLATAVGLNFPLLGMYFTGRESVQWLEPDEGEASVPARLLGREVGSETVMRFQDCFSKATQEWLNAPAVRARQLLEAGRLQAALGQYHQALERQPHNWPLMAEVAQLLTFQLGNAKAGLEMARAALKHNPACSALLWNLLGESLAGLGRNTDASMAFGRALQISPDDVRARVGIGGVHVAFREYQQALVRLAEGLSLDKSGGYGEYLLNKQQEVLGLLGQQHQKRHQGLANRVTKAATASGKRASPETAFGRTWATGRVEGQARKQEDNKLS